MIDDTASAMATTITDTPAGDELDGQHADLAVPAQGSGDNGGDIIALTEEEAVVVRDFMLAFEDGQGDICALSLFLVDHTRPLYHCVNLPRGRR